MKECAFCTHEGKLTNEHLVSEWLDKLFPGPINVRRKVDDEFIDFTNNSIDYKVKTVCKKCNEDWMARIEDRNIPVLTPLVIGKLDVPISAEDAYSIALFALLKAIVIDYSERDREPIFPRRVRHAFRKHRRIPNFVNIYICPFVGNRPNGRIRTVTHKGKLPSGNSFQLYVVTYAAGHFVFQVTAATQYATREPFEFRTDFREGVAVRIWPEFPSNYVWPHRAALMSSDEFNAFAMRWERIKIMP